MLVGKPAIASSLLDLRLAATLRGRLHGSAGVIDPLEVLLENLPDLLIAATSGLSYPFQGSEDYSSVFDRVRVIPGQTYKFLEKDWVELFLSFCRQKASQIQFHSNSFELIIITLIRL